MDPPDIFIALRAVQSGELERESLARIFEVADTWQRAGLKISCAEVLTREFRISTAKVRRWESEAAGHQVHRIGQYPLKRRIGQGGMGVVFEATHPNLDRPVALKILSPGLGREPSAIQRFLREVKSAGHFNHPNIVHAYDAGIDGDLPYLVMEFIDGENLFQVLLRQGPIASDTALRWLLQAASALSVVEAAGWIHGDGKPSNWILAPGGILKLADHGLCRPPGAPPQGEITYGSPPYIAPEQLAEGARVDIRSDLYSLGATFYHLVSGRPPYETRSVPELRRLQEAETIPPLKEVRPDVDPALAAIIMRLLSPDPGNRYPDTGELIAELEAITGLRAHRVDAPFSGRSAKRTEKRPLRIALTVILTLAVLVLVAVIAKGFFGGSRETGQRDPESSGPSETDIVPTPGGALAGWQELWNAEPRDYSEILNRLDTAWADEPLAAEWRAEAQRALGAEADAVWKKVEADARAFIEARAYTRAEEVIDGFDGRLRIGSYRVSFDRVEAEIREARGRRFAGLLLGIRTALAAGAPWRARQLFRGIDGDPPEEREPLRRRVAKELGGLPWAEAAADSALAMRRERLGRHEEVVRALRAGELPAPRLEPHLDLLTEMALDLLSAEPALPKAAGDFRLALYRSGLLAGSPAPLLERAEQLLTDSPPSVSMAAECEAARLFVTARHACLEWDVAEAERAWQEASVPGYRETTAWIRESDSIAEARRLLADGTFLRSDAFVAEVSGAFGEAPRLFYDFADSEVLAEWRSDASKWRATDDGRTAKTGGLEPLESMIPFSGEFSARFVVDVPPPGWMLLLELGSSTLALGYRNIGELLVGTGERRAAVQQLEDAATHWIAGAVALESNPVTVELRVEAQQWTVRVGDGSLVLPMSPVEGPFWFRLMVPNGLTVRTASLEGAPSSIWLAARKRKLP